MQNLVVVSHTSFSLVGDPKILGDAGPHPLGWGRGRLPRNTQPLRARLVNLTLDPTPWDGGVVDSLETRNPYVCYHTKFCRSIGQTVWQ